MPILHLIHGFTGAGKTTFAKKLEQETGAVRFSPDEWMVRMHGVDPGPKFQDYYDNIDIIIWEMAACFLERKCDVIMDGGFWSRASRDKARAFAAQHQAEIKLYNLVCPDDLMRQRVLKRTVDLPFGALVIDENAIEVFKTRFEALATDEEFIVIDTSVSH